MSTYFDYRHFGSHVDIYSLNRSTYLDANDNWNWDWTSFRMYGGDDTVIVPYRTDSLNFRGYDMDGGSGNDYLDPADGQDQIHGGLGSDTVNGNGGNDYLYGDDNNDRVSGGSGADHLYGGAGRDIIRGGEGADYLFGGTGQSVNGEYRDDYAGDTFVILKGGSDITNGQFDTIYDWSQRYDYIQSNIAGTSTNYAERETFVTSMDDARQQVNNDPVLREYRHVYLYNQNTDTGYLMSDIDGNDRFETGVKIVHGGSSNEMAWSDIIGLT